MHYLRSCENGKGCVVMENSRRSKKRSKFFWPEIGLLILGVLGFKPDLLFDIVGVGNHSSYGTTRPANQQQPTGQQPLTSNPLLAWGVQAIQSAASQTMAGLPVAAPPHGQHLQTQQPYYPNYPTVQNPPYQQQLNYGDYGNPVYQSAPNAPGYSYPNANWSALNNNNYYVPTATANFPGPGSTNRVPPVDYQNTPTTYPAPLRPNTPFPSTNTTSQSINPAYGSNYGANVRKEGTGYTDPRLSQLQPNQAQYPAPQYQTPQYPVSQYQTAIIPNSQPLYSPAANGVPLYSQPQYALAGVAQTQAYSNFPNQSVPQSQDQYFWGAVDPRVNSIQRAGTQGSWVPNVPASNPASGRTGRY